MEKVSVIIPAYQAEKTLERCISSILKQTYHDIEIIVVDDGSTDKTFEIAQKMQCNDNRVQSFRKENGGVASARNTGLGHANGKYVTFVDSDDWLRPETIEKLMRGAVADIVVGEIEQRAYKYRFELENGIKLCEIEEISKMFDILYSANFFNSVCGKLYRRTLITNCTFREGVRCGEDLLFNFQVFAFVNTVAIVEQCGYVYVSNVNSATHRFDEMDLKQQKDLREEAIRFARGILNSNSDLSVIDKVYLRNMTDIVANLVTYEKGDMVKKHLQNLFQDRYFLSIVSQYDSRNLDTDMKRKICLWMIKERKYKLLLMMGAVNNLRYRVKRTKAGTRK